MRAVSLISKTVSDKFRALCNSARRFTAARLLFAACVFLCAAIPIYQGVDHLLSLRRDTLTVSAETAALRVLPPEDAPENGKININSATLDDLTRVPGIGPALAQSILDFRDAVGGFRFLEEALDVSGIGQKRLEALRACFYCPLP